MWTQYEITEDTESDVATAAEHNYMANSFINPIAEGLREYDHKLHTVENYKYFAWEGLEYYGKQSHYITENELKSLANLTLNVHNDGYTSECD